MVSCGRVRAVLYLRTTHATTRVRHHGTHHVVGVSFHATRHVTNVPGIHPILIVRLTCTRTLTISTYFNTRRAIGRLLLTRFRTRRNCTAQFTTSSFIHARHCILRGIRHRHDFARKEAHYRGGGVKEVRATHRLIRVHGTYERAYGATLILRRAFSALRAIRRCIIGYYGVHLFLTIKGFRGTTFHYVRRHASVLVNLVTRDHGFNEGTRGLARGQFFNGGVHVMFGINHHRRRVHRANSMNGTTSILRLVIALRSFHGDGRVCYFVFVVGLRRHAGSGTVHFTMGVVH